MPSACRPSGLTCSSSKGLISTRSWRGAICTRTTAGARHAEAQCRARPPLLPAPAGLPSVSTICVFEVHLVSSIGLANAPGGQGASADASGCLPWSSPGKLYQQSPRRTRAEALVAGHSLHSATVHNVRLSVLAGLYTGLNPQVRADPPECLLQACDERATDRAMMPTCGVNTSNVGW